MEQIGGNGGGHGLAGGIRIAPNLFQALADQVDSIIDTL